MDVEIKIAEKMENWEEFEVLLRTLLREIYGDEELGMRIYSEKYNAINYYRNYRKRKNSYLLIAVYNKRSIGFLYGRKFKNYSYLYDIVVLPEFRGKGVGKNLVEKFVNLANLPIYADVQKNAMPFFKKLGFEILNEYEEDGVIWYRMVKK